MIAANIYRASPVREGLLLILIWLMEKLRCSEGK